MLSLESSSLLFMYRESDAQENKIPAGLIMVISGTVSAGGVANTPENRQFLKQQEELSRQLRDRPDAELKAWADRQIQANPGAVRPAFLDDLARKQQTSQADKPEQGAVYFISFSIPEEG